MKAELGKLLTLQEIDLEALKLREQLILYPPMLKRLDQNLARKQKEFESLKNQRKDTQKARHILEKEIEYKKEQTKRFLTQQMDVKDNKSYAALTREIENVKAEISRLEDKILESIAAEEEFEKSLREAENHLKREQEDARIERERIEEQMKSKKRRLAHLKKNREEQLLHVPQHLLQYYSRFYKSYGPNVVVKVEGDSCGGCHMRILPQILVEIHKGDKIVYCEGCRRILMPEE